MHLHHPAQASAARTAPAAVSGEGAPAGRRRIAERERRWDEALARDAYARGWWTRATLGEALASAARTTPDRVAVIDDALRIDCATLDRRARLLASALRAHLAPGSTVSFMLPNWHEAVEIYLAASLAGMIVHPILPALRETELAAMLEDVGSRMLFVPAELRGFDYPAMVAKVARRLAMPPLAVTVRGAVPGCLDHATLLAGAAPGPLPDVDPDAVSMVLHTSGTTGMPKGVMHSQNSLGALARQLGRHWLIEPGDRFLVPSPIGHIGGSIYAFELPILLGTTAVLMERWNAEAALGLMAAERITHIAGATPFLAQLLAAAGRAEERLPDLKLFVCGGASVSPDLVRAAAAHFDRAVVTRVYGSSEVPVTTIGTVDPAAREQAATTDGRAGIAAVRLVPHAAIDAPGGEIWARGPQMLAGYWHAADEAGLFDGDGFYRTGDLGRWQDGGLVIAGRSKDIIVRNGENISPKEVEDVLGRHPAIAEVALVGLPDARTGERACAVVVPVPGAHLRLGELAPFLREAGIAAFKLPEQLELWPSLPRNDAGKVLKAVIRARLADRPGSG